jgi:hypothetical protein
MQVSAARPTALPEHYMRWTDLSKWEALSGRSEFLDLIKAETRSYDISPAEVFNSLD